MVHRTASWVGRQPILKASQVRRIAPRINGCASSNISNSPNNSLVRTALRSAFPLSLIIIHPLTSISPICLYVLAVDLSLVPFRISFARGLDHLDTATIPATYSISSHIITAQFPLRFVWCAQISHLYNSLLWFRYLIFAVFSPLWIVICSFLRYFSLGDDHWHA